MCSISGAIQIEDARRAWSALLGALLDSAGAAAGLNTTERRVRELANAGELIALDDRAGGSVYPAFQFIVGAPHAALLDVWRILCDAAVSPWTAASWCASPDPALADQSPAQWAAQGHDPAVLVRIARRDAARLAR